MHRDTSPEQQARYFALLRAMTPRQREDATRAAMLLGRRLAEEAVRHEHPEASEVELRIRIAVRVYGHAAAERLFGPVPDDAR